MTRRVSKVVFVFVVASAAAMALMGLHSCNRAFSIPLGWGYSLERQNRSMTSISKIHKVCVHANVVRVSVGRDFILGYAKSNGPGWEEACPTPGYFFIDAQSGAIHQGLDAQEFLELTGLGSLDDAKLVDVSFWTVPRGDYKRTCVSGGP